MITEEQIQALKKLTQLTPDVPRDSSCEIVNPALFEFYCDTLFLDPEYSYVTEADAVQALDQLLEF
jgi:hypothetical protein